MQPLKTQTIKTLAISLCTYKRPNLLRNAIRAIKNVRIPKDLSAQLVVIDNYPTEEVKEIVEVETADLGFPSKYVEEERRGLVFARNRALQEAEALNVDYIAFFDDDDHPDEGWLENLWNCMNEYSATVVTGRMTFTWPETCTLNEEVKRIYDRRRMNFQTGEIKQRCGSCNTLFDFQFSRKHNLSFNPIFNLTGGEDSHFFESMTLKGAKIVWCEEAVVYSDIVEERTTENYIRNRRQTVGYTAYLRDQLLFGKTKALRKGMSSIIRNGFWILKNYFAQSERTRVKRTMKKAELKGLVKAMLGKPFDNYAKTDGS